MTSACAKEDEKRQQDAADPATSASAQEALAAGQDLLQRGELRQAEAQFERAVELDPRLAEAHFDLGQLRVTFAGQVEDSKQMSFARMNREELQRAIDSIVRAVELEPENDRYVSWLGRAYHQADDLVNARRCLEKAVALAPDNAESLKRLGMVYVAIPETELAKAALEKAIALEPHDAGSYFQLGQVLEVLRDSAGARAAYENAIASNPSQPEFYRKLMTVLERLGDRAGADLAEKNLARWQEFGEKLERRQKKVNQNPRDEAAVRRLGEAYLEAERWKIAADWCSKALVLDPTDAQAHLCCGVAHRHLEEYDAAKTHLREAEFRAPTLLDAKLELVRLYAETGDERALAEIVSEVEVVGAKDGEALLELGLVCGEVGRGADSERLLGKARALGVTPPPPGVADSRPTPGGR